MEGRTVLRTIINDIKMILPLEKRFKNMPQIGHRLDIGDVFGPCATVIGVTHGLNGFSYPGEVMRREGIDSCFGVGVYFSTMIDVELDEDFYDPHTAETWKGQMGWDIVSDLGKYVRWA